MLRPILGVIVSYVALFLLWSALFFGAYALLGPERAFQADSYEVSSLWLWLTGAVTFFGAVAGGYLCARISKSNRACQVLAFVVFLIAILLCIKAMRRDVGGLHVRAGEVTRWEAVGLAVEPNWMHLLNPVIGAAGILLGARFGFDRKP
jgi:predicted MFS family arabinose efflux permease